LGLAIDRHRIDVSLAVCAELLREFRCRGICGRIWVCQQAIIQILTEEQALYKADLLQSIAENFFCFCELFFTIWRRHILLLVTSYALRRLWAKPLDTLI